MKCRQYDVKVFEMKIESENSFIDFMENNYELLKNHLISLKGEVTPKIEEYLNNKGLSFVDNISLPAKKRGAKDVCITTPTSEEKRVEKEPKPAVAEEPSEVEVVPEEIKRVHISEKDIIEKSSTIEEYGYGVSPLKVLTRPLRSGQFVQHDGAILIMERVNSGARIAALGSIIALSVVEGDISSTGECLIIPRVKKGNIFFHGHRIDLDKLVYPLNKLIFLGDRIVVQAISKKELI